MNCECALYDFCRRYQRVMTEVEHRICSGQAFDPDVTDMYRDYWAGLAAQTDEMARQQSLAVEREKRIAKAYADERQRREYHQEFARSCRYHGVFVRNERCNVGCNSTGRGRLFNVHQCRHPDIVALNGGECSDHPKHTRIQWCFGCEYHERTDGG